MTSNSLIYLQIFHIHQDRIMIAITTMMVVATIQSSINKMVPKTSYIKMIDVWLLYSFNIIIVMMIVHTYMDSYVKRDPQDKRLPIVTGDLRPVLSKCL